VILKANRTFFRKNSSFGSEFRGKRHLGPQNFLKIDPHPSKVGCLEIKQKQNNQNFTLFWHFFSKNFHFKDIKGPFTDFDFLWSTKDYSCLFLRFKESDWITNLHLRFLTASY
jgi:hypothetical protein